MSFSSAVDQNGSAWCKHLGVTEWSRQKKKTKIKKISEKTQTDRCWAKCDAFNYSSGQYLKAAAQNQENTAWHVPLVKKNTF